MPSSSPTESYKIQLDISAAIKHETNRGEQPPRHHESYHSGPTSRTTMEVQSNPSPSHYQASILIRPSPSTSRLDATAPHIKAEAYVPPKEMRPEPAPTVIATPVAQSRPSVLTPVMKRESPLDLSVKTVKTKADSTGSDLSQQMYRRVDDRYVLPKVEFHPNFTPQQQQQQPLAPGPPNERSQSDHFDPRHPVHLREAQQQHSVSSNINQKYSQGNTNSMLPHHPSNQRMSEIPNPKYYEQSGHRSQEPSIIPPHQPNDRTIHIAVGEPYRHDMQINSQRQMQRQDTINSRHTPYPMNERPGTSSTKPQPIHSQSRGSVINNPNDPQRLEDRKYVESILYKKQPPPSAIANAEITFRYVHDKHGRPISPRKRSSEYNENVHIPPKQVRYDTLHREMPPHIQSHMNQGSQPSNYPPYSEPKSMYPREPVVEIHAHKMIFERYPPESRTLHSPHQYPKTSNDDRQRPNIYPDPRQPESKSHATVVKTIPKDSFRHDPKDEPRAGFPPPPDTQKSYPPPHMPYYPRPNDNVSNNVDLSIQSKQTAVTWHPSVSPSQSRISQQAPDRYDIRNQYNARADALDTEKREQIPIPRENHSSPNIVIEPKVVPPHSGSPGGSSAINASKGADINTINKLRTSIEQKEIERQRLMMKKQNSSEMSEDDNNKADIASILAARIRTKGELKGFTPVPVIETPRKESPVEIPKDPIEPPADIEGTTPFDVMDWGNACNDFVDQLQTGKKRGRRKRPLKEVDRKDIKIDPYTNTNANAENLSNVPVEVLKSIQETGALSNSSDEDKPLKLLRQQSTPECKDEDSLGPRKGSETCSSAIKCGALGERTSQSLRKKQRLVLEQKIAARIGTGSSSDTEPEDKPSVRTKKRKLRTRSSLGMKESEKSNNERSDTKQNKTDDESSSDEKITKTISQLDGSSDSDNQDKSSRKRLSSRNRSHVDNKSKHSEHSESERRKSLSKSKSSKSKSKNSDSESQKEETMTRSKRKLEMEKKISNSKVLRNDKIVQNKTVKKPKNVQEVASKANNTKTQLEKNASNKKKDDSKNEAKRKHLESDCEQNKSKTGKRMTRNLSKIESSESSSEEEDAKTDRLRPRKAKTTPSKEEVVGIKRKNSKVEEDSKKSTPHKKSSQKPENPVKEKYPPGWEAQLYAFKKSLKIPARLINVTPNNQRYSTSLPDLDPHSSDASEFSETSKTSSLQTQIKTEDNENDSTPNHKKPSKKSIIDLLHQRVTPSMNKMMQKKKKGESVQVKSSENDLLPTPVVEKNEKQTTSVKKNIFDLSILKTRTRNEQKHMKHKEIIREIFCGEDRPSSAPPLGLDLNTTFDQKFGQIMKKMDDVVASTSIVIKQEKPDDTFIPPHDEETTDTVLNVNNDLEDSHDRDLDTPSVNSERDIITPTSFKEMPKPAKKGRVSRRKQSSGFDYIRKKKKPVTNVDGTPVPSKRRIAAVNYLQEKDENDISKEVKGWVLNKGVGESYLHKAARLGYLDVIAYCLFRIDMDVDTKDNAGYTALHEACTRGNLGIVRLLLQCGANHSVTAFSGIRPLHEAVQHNYIEIARLLLAYGADPSLSTYSGQTPETLAETKEMTDLLNYYLKDMQGVSCPPWRFNPPWQQYDSDSDGLDNFDGVSELFNDTTPERTTPVKTVSKTCDSNLNNNIIKINDEKIKYKSCSVVLNNIDHLKSFNSKSLRKSIDIIDSTIKSQFSDLIPANPESDGELFEFEETDYPLPPLYLLQNEGSDKWIMLTDLCNILKVKSKDAVLKQIDPTIPTATLNKELIRELKINEFIEKATCLQLLCAGEKLNVRASKVVLVRYNEAVKKLMNIQTIVLKF
uniref:CSON003597 protein n=1 Tax=Culicoides sonorensis TaxID=179676 RepID=A0A336MNU7_CULSO